MVGGRVWGVVVGRWVRADESGSAAARCGMAMPFRPHSLFILRGCASEIGGIASKHLFRFDGKAKPFRTVLRQSRESIDFSGKAISGFQALFLPGSQGL